MINKDDVLFWQQMTRDVIKQKHEKLSPPMVPLPRGFRRRLPIDHEENIPDKKAQEVHLSRKEQRRLSAHHAIERRIDLHGLTSAQALEVLGRFLRQSHMNGLKCILVITGKGQNILRQCVADYLKASSHFVARFSSASQNDGGEGAYYVFLR